MAGSRPVKKEKLIQIRPCHSLSKREKRAYFVPGTMTMDLNRETILLMYVHPCDRGSCTYTHVLAGSPGGGGGGT